MDPLNVSVTIATIFIVIGGLVVMFHDSGKAQKGE